MDATPSKGELFLSGRKKQTPLSGRAAGLRGFCTFVFQIKQERYGNRQ
jgi:hypothetical protein